MKTRIKSSDRMSNTRYHRNGKPIWWARIGEGSDATFLKIGYVRGDMTLDVVVEVPDGTTEVEIGCGPRDRHGCRETVRVVPLPSEASQ